MLLVRPNPKPEEHLLTFMLRVSWANHMRCVQDLVQMCQLNTLSNRVAYRKLVYGDFDIDKLAKSLNISNALLNEYLIKFNKRFFTIENRVIPVSTISFRRPKFCPRCLLDKGYIPNLNFISPVTYCFGHQCTFCTEWEDGKPFEWSSHWMLDRIREGSYLVGQPKRGEIGLNRIITDLWQHQKSTELSAPLKDLSLNDFLLVLKFTSRFNHKRNRSLASKNHTRSEWGAAFMLLEKWPYGIHSMFARFEKYPLALNRGNGIRATYRDLYNELYSGPYRKTQAYLLIQREFERFVSRPASNTPLWSANHTLLPDNTIEYITVSNAQKIIGCREKGMQRYIELGLLKPARKTGSGMTLLRRSDVFNFNKRKELLLSLTKVSEMLEVSDQTVKKLAETGALEYLGKPEEKFRDWIFEYCSVASLIEKLRKSAKTYEIESVNKCSSLKRLNFLKSSIVDIVNKMLDGSISYTVDKNPKNKLSLHQFHPITKFNQAHSGYLSPKQCAHAINANINAVYYCVKIGLLKSEKISVDSYSRPILLIPNLAIKQFKQKYVIKPTSTENLHHISGPKIDGGIVNIYKKQK